MGIEASLARGDPVVLADPRASELLLPLTQIDTASVTFALRRACGQLRVAAGPSTVERLGLVEIARSPGAPRSAMRHMIGVEAAIGVTTGISSADRARTLRVVGDPASRASDLVMPGHIAPLAAEPGGDLTPDAALALAHGAGIGDAIGLCHLLSPDGQPLGVDEALAFAESFGLEATTWRQGDGVSPALFADAMSSLASGVCLVMTRSPDGVPVGLAATSVCSFSATDPSILVAIDHNSRSRRSLVDAPCFAVDLLSHHQQEIAALFASRAENKFASLPWSWDRDVPRLDGALGHLRCRRAATFEHSDHTILIGEVLGIERTEGAPLLYHDRALDWQLIRAS